MANVPNNNEVPKISNNIEAPAIIEGLIKGKCSTKLDARHLDTDYKQASNEILSASNNYDEYTTIDSFLFNNAKRKMEESLGSKITVPLMKTNNTVDKRCYVETNYDSEEYAEIDTLLFTNVKSRMQISSGSKMYNPASVVDTSVPINDENKEINNILDESVGSYLEGGINADNNGNDSYIDNVIDAIDVFEENKDEEDIYLSPPEVTVFEKIMLFFDFFRSCIGDNNINYCVACSFLDLTESIAYSVLVALKQQNTTKIRKQLKYTLLLKYDNYSDHRNLTKGDGRCMIR